MKHQLQHFALAIALVTSPMAPAIAQNTGTETTTSGGHGLQYQQIITRIAEILGISATARTNFIATLANALNAYLSDAVIMADKHMMLGDPMDVTLLIKSNAIRLEFPEGYARFLVAPAPSHAVTYDGIYLPVIIVPDEAPRMMRVMSEGVMVQPPFQDPQ